MNLHLCWWLLLALYVVSFFRMIRSDVEAGRADSAMIGCWVVVVTTIVIAMLLLLLEF